MGYARSMAAIGVGLLVFASAAGTSAPAWGEDYRLTLQPLRAPRAAPMKLAADPAPTDSSVLWLAETMLAESDKAGSNLHLLPDQKELAEAPNRHTLLTGLVKEESMYGKAWFPETLRNSEMDLEYQEGRIDFYHQEKPGHYFSEGKAEFEQAFGALTVEIELPWQHETEHDPLDPSDPGERREGFSRVEVGTRYPLFQLLSDDAVIDYTCVGVFEFAIPTHAHWSQDFELSPRTYHLLRIGDHFSIQTAVGTEHLIGPDRGGTVTLIYGTTLGWSIYPEEFHLPGVLTTIPIAEITGEHLLTGDKEGPFATSTFGVLGIRFNMESFGGFQPRIGLGYVFPLDQGSRDEMHWGTLISCVFEF